MDEEIAEKQIGQVIIKKIWKFKLLLLLYATAICTGDIALPAACEMIFCDEEPIRILIDYHICEYFDAAHN